MIHSINRLMLAAPKSGSGKTTITCGLLSLFQLKNITCRSFKCGPDFIDPMFHKHVLGIDGGNLDTFFLEKKEVSEQLIHQSQGSSLSLIEGVMGYYDGMGGNQTWASSYDVANAVSAPVVLILDGKGASLSLVPVVKGFLEYKEDSQIAGVILNRTSSVIAERLTPEIEALGVRVYGYLPECEEARLSSRHLGLVLPEEQRDLKEKFGKLARKLDETIDVEGLIHLAGNAPALQSESVREYGAAVSKNKEKVAIGIARDEAFCFYYQENLKLLEEMGAKLIPFSPLHEEHLPEGICGLILGGGYPELYLNELSHNSVMREEIRLLAALDLPILAECGGFLYLHEEVESKEHVSYPMAGVIKGRGYPVGKLVRFGYIEALVKKQTAFLNQGEKIRGHEFHYWDSTNNGTYMEAGKPGREQRYSCMHGEESILAGFPHLYYPSNPCLPQGFIKNCRNWEKTVGKKGFNHE
ncbi:cobyrinate a,c-diamide synthase [Clostridium sp. E02]|uniref:cobyrinate a,c-diamide synthase n=1 Tax=Clostridium sp. E02 TaxID=2487134 RepID=UPI001FAA0F95|nr:cobyrinate a,c-diamide synthase [Clostridium sp. E02]